MILTLLFIIFTLAIFMYKYISSFYYAFSLLMISLTFLMCLTFSGHLTSFFPLLIILIYIGAMMVMVGYICCVLPNEYYHQSPMSKFWYTLLLLLLIPISFFTQYPTLSNQPIPSLYLSEFYYLSGGLYLLFYLIFMLLMSLIVISFSINLKSTFRSV